MMKPWTVLQELEAWTVLQELEADNSRLKKEAIIKRESDADNKDFFDGVCMALDGFRTFGIQKVPTSNKDGAGLSWDVFYLVARQMEERTLTGNDMRDAVDDLCGRATKEQWNDWYQYGS